MKPIEAVALKSFWVSWFSQTPLSQFEYHGPWWVSGAKFNGEDMDTVPSVVAAIRAPDEVEAMQLIGGCYDKGADILLEWRFAVEKPDDWSPFGSDRFVKADWMQWPYSPPPPQD